MLVSVAYILLIVLLKAVKICKLQVIYVHYMHVFTHYLKTKIIEEEDSSRVVIWISLQSTTSCNLGPDLKYTVLSALDLSKELDCKLSGWAACAGPSVIISRSCSDPGPHDVLLTTPPMGRHKDQLRNGLSESPRAAQTK